MTGDDAELVARVDSLFEGVDALKKRVQALERELGRTGPSPCWRRRSTSTGVVAGRAGAGNSPEALREMGDWLRDRLGSAVLVLGTVVEGRPHLVAMVTPDLADTAFDAGELVKRVAAVTGGGGGGHPEWRRPAGRDASRLDEALRLAKELAAEKIRALKK